MKHYNKDRVTNVELVQREIIEKGGDLSRLTPEQIDDLALADCFDMIEDDVMCDIYPKKN